MFAMKLSMSNLNFIGQLPTCIAQERLGLPRSAASRWNRLEMLYISFLWVYFVSLQDNCLQSIFQALLSRATSTNVSKFLVTVLYICHEFHQMFADILTNLSQAKSQSLG